MSSSYNSLDFVCHTGPISLCIDLFMFICVYFVCFCFILHICCIIVSMVEWTWWDWSLILRTYLPSVLWHCWLGHLTHKNSSPIWPIMCLVGRYTSFNQSIQPMWFHWPCDCLHSLAFMLLGGLFNNEDVQASQDRGEAQLSARVLDAISHVTTSDAASRQSSSSSGCHLTAYSAFKVTVFWSIHCDRQ